MSAIEDIERAVSHLPPDQYARFRAWFEEFEAARFDNQIEGHVREGKLDGFAEEALADARKGLARDL